MGNNYFNFKQFTVSQRRSLFKVGTDGVLLGACADVKNRKRILDVGTGSGLIALMLAQRCDAEIVAIEPDKESFEQASENVLKCRWAERIKVINCSLQDYQDSGETFGLIVSNPPYFIDSLKNPDPARAKARHNLTLDHSDILTGAGKLLRDDGILQLIMPYTEGTVFMAQAVRFDFFCSHILKIRSTPTSGIRRLILTMNREKKKASEQFLTIESGKRHDFTDEYINLTRDFYLKF
ncbi:MAG: methyltransferase [Bacteroidales bacterium]|nr:methyltransferase [Bacteroidales bacterium]